MTEHKQTHSYGFAEKVDSRFRGNDRRGLFNRRAR